MAEIAPAKKPIKASEIDPKFKYEILKMPGGEKLLRCFQCGTCTASCPIIRAAGDTFVVRKLLKMTLLGLRERVLTSEVLWYCASCHTCVERCPQGVEIAEVLTVLRNFAVKEGYIPETIRLLASNVAKFGLIFEVTEDLEAMREMVELPPIPKVNKDHISKILKEAGFLKILGVATGDSS